MESKSHWSRFFENWPDKMPKRGVVVTSFGEQILFSGFLVGDDLLIVDRQSPDTVGARQVVLPYGNIVAVKIVEVARQSVWKALGYSGQRSSK